MSENDSITHQEPISQNQKSSKPKGKHKESKEIPPSTAITTTSTSRFAHMKDLHLRWSNGIELTENPQPREIATDWRTAIKEPLASNDIIAMKEASQIPAELNMLRLAHEADSEQVQFNATAYILGQGGNSPITKSEVSIEYKKMPDEQLLNQLASNLQKLSKFNPNLNILKELSERFQGSAVFDEDAIDVEYAESPESVA